MSETVGSRGWMAHAGSGQAELWRRYGVTVCVVATSAEDETGMTRDQTVQPLSY